MPDSLPVRGHDAYQFELKLGYALRPERPQNRYRVDIFFFIPENLDVNEGTYSTAQFYRDLLLYIRFRTPDFTLEDLADPASERSPLARAPGKLEAYLAEPGPATARGVDYELRLLGCVFKNALRLRAREIEQAPPAQAAALIDGRTRWVREITARYRALKDRFHSPGVPAGLAATHAFVDEYLSLLIESQSHEILQRLPPSPALRESLERTVALIEAETDHRRKAGYPSLIEEGRDNETFVFRHSVLKKFVTSALHLVVRTQEEGKGLEQVALAAGAGVAMVFATTIAFFYQKVYGTLSLGFFAILVVSYMFKDRLKAAAQNALRRRLAKHLFDQATAIHDPFSGARIGVCREAVGFVPERKVDPRVLRLRDRDHITEIENTWRAEKVIHYVKEITLFNGRFMGSPSRKSGLTDIMRFDVRHFLLKMDEPEMDLHFLKDGRSATTRGTRVYHVNLVIAFVSEAETRYQRVRLVLNREGIKRIESVASDRLNPDEDD